MENQYKEPLKALKALIKKDYGKQCKAFSIGCVVCQVWLAIDILEDISAGIDAENKHEKIHDPLKTRGDIKK